MGKIVVSYWWTKINPLIYKGFLVRETGLEPASTYVHMNLNHARLPIPPFPQKMVGRGGFEPPKLIAADLQSAPFGHSGTYPYKLPLDPKGGAGDGTRTRNLLITNQLLCQLSYTSITQWERKWRPGRGSNPRPPA